MKMYLLIYLLREEQDEFAAKSQKKAGVAIAAAAFADEIVPVSVQQRKTTTVVRYVLGVTE